MLRPSRAGPLSPSPLDDLAAPRGSGVRAATSLLEVLAPSRPRLLTALAVLGSAALVAVGARLAVPLEPVPTTLQTLALCLCAGALGGRLGAASALVYLLLACAGLPVLAQGRSFSAPQFARTGGYLLAFVPAAALCGWTSTRSFPPRFAPTLLAMLLAHLVILVSGTLWLARTRPLGQAFEVGFLPFVLAAAGKSVVGATALMAAGRVATQLARGRGSTGE